MTTRAKKAELYEKQRTAPAIRQKMQSAIVLLSDVLQTYFRNDIDHTGANLCEAKKAVQAAHKLIKQAYWNLPEDAQ